jgi:hypothetical protein
LRFTTETQRTQSGAQRKMNADMDKLNKLVEALAPIHDAQLLTYLRIGGYRLGLLINFNVVVLKDGIHRRIL